MRIGIHYFSNLLQDGNRLQIRVNVQDMLETKNPGTLDGLWSVILKFPFRQGNPGTLSTLAEQTWTTRSSDSSSG